MGGSDQVVRRFSHTRDLFGESLVDQLRVQRSQAKEESAGLRARADSAMSQLNQLQKVHERLEEHYLNNLKI
jgi:hypothetical protein